MATVRYISGGRKAKGGIRAAKGSSSYNPKKAARGASSSGQLPRDESFYDGDKSQLDRAEQLAVAYYETHPMDRAAQLQAAKEAKEEFERQQQQQYALMQEQQQHYSSWIPMARTAAEPTIQEKAYEYQYQKQQQPKIYTPTANTYTFQQQQTLRGYAEQYGEWKAMVARQREESMTSYQRAERKAGEFVGKYFLDKENIKRQQQIYQDKRFPITRRAQAYISYGIGSSLRDRPITTGITIGSMYVGGVGYGAAMRTVEGTRLGAAAIKAGDIVLPTVYGTFATKGYIETEKQARPSYVVTQAAGLGAFGAGMKVGYRYSPLRVAGAEFKVGGKTQRLYNVELGFGKKMQYEAMFIPKSTRVPAVRLQRFSGEQMELAITRGGRRVSPKSKAQRRKESMQQYYNPKRITDVQKGEIGYRVRSPDLKKMQLTKERRIKVDRTGKRIIEDVPLRRGRALRTEYYPSGEEISGMTRPTAPRKSKLYPRGYGSQAVTRTAPTQDSILLARYTKKVRQLPEPMKMPKRKPIKPEPFVAPRVSTQKEQVSIFAGDVKVRGEPAPLSVLEKQPRRKGFRDAMVDRYQIMTREEAERKYKDISGAGQLIYKTGKGFMPAFTMRQPKGLEFPMVSATPTGMFKAGYDSGLAGRERFGVDKIPDFRKDIFDASRQFPRERVDIGTGFGFVPAIKTGLGIGQATIPKQTQAMSLKQDTMPEFDVVTDTGFDFTTRRPPDFTPPDWTPPDTPPRRPPDFTPPDWTPPDTPPRRPPEEPPDTPPPFTPPSFPKLSYPSARFGLRKPKQTKAKQPRKYTPSGFAAVFEIKGKPTKAGIKTGLGLRPIRRKIKKPRIRRLI